MTEPVYSVFLSPKPGEIHLDVEIPRTVGGGVWPHKVDIYVPLTGYTRAMVCLHGGGGRKGQFAVNCMVTSAYPPTQRTVNWAMLDRFNVVAVFPQGQACLGPLPSGEFNPFNPKNVDSRSPEYPNGVASWDNGFTWSGVDDMSFLRDLKAYIAATYLPNRPGAVNLAGNSAGGMMAKRVWQQSGGTFANYCTVAGPMSQPDSLLAGSGTRPLWMQVGQLDENLNVSGGPLGPGLHFYDDVWSQAYNNLARINVAYPALSQWQGDWRTAQRAFNWQGGVGTISPGSGVSTGTPSGGTLTTWNFLSGKIRVRLVSNGTHDFVQQQKVLRQRLFGQWMAWIIQLFNAEAGG
jgi:hypothetical protein